MPISSLVYNCIIWIYAFEEAGIMWIWANQEGIFSSEDSSDFETQRNVSLFLDDPLRMVSPNLSDKSVDFLIAFTVILDFQQGYGRQHTQYQTHCGIWRLDNISSHFSRSVVYTSFTWVLV